MSQPRISIVIPVFNAGTYIADCLQSLYAQQLREDEFEVILVNDGSSDNSLVICEAFGRNHTNIHIVSQQNMGVSAARNAGIALAKGDYLCFVDADDELVNGSLRYLIDNFLVAGTDVVRYWCKITTEGQAIPTSVEGEINFEGCGFDYIKRFGLDTFCYVYFYRVAYLQEHDLTFKSYKIGEDFLFVSSVLLSNPHIVSTTCVAYLYLIHPNTASTSRDVASMRKCVDDHLAVHRELLGIISSMQLSQNQPDVHARCMESINFKTIMIFSRMLSANYTLPEFKGRLSQLRDMGLLPMCPVGDSLKSRLSRTFVNLLACLPFLYGAASLIYRKLFVPYFLPNIDRNNL